MPLHRSAPATQTLYANAITDLACFSWLSPDQLSPADIHVSLHHLLPERQIAWSPCNVTPARRFFYVETLGWSPLHPNLPPRSAHQRLPQVLRVEELQRLFRHSRNPKHRALLMTTYAAGLRVSEVGRLRGTDIESAPGRMLIRINQGKGRRDRDILLATRLLQDLRTYRQTLRRPPNRFWHISAVIPIRWPSHTTALSMSVTDGAAFPPALGKQATASRPWRSLLTSLSNGFCCICYQQALSAFALAAFWPIGAQPKP